MGQMRRKINDICIHNMNNFIDWSYFLKKPTQICWTLSIKLYCLCQTCRSMGGEYKNIILKSVLSSVSLKQTVVCMRDEEHRVTEGCSSNGEGAASMPMHSPSHHLYLGYAARWHYCRMSCPEPITLSSLLRSFPLSTMHPGQLVN